MNITNRTVRSKCIAFLMTACIYCVGHAQNNLVPNTSDCAGTRLPFAFNIQQVWNAAGVSHACTPLAGDLDGDGRIEVITMGTEGSGGNILIFDGQTGASSGSLLTGRLSSHPVNSYAICDIEGDGKAELFVVDVMPAIPTATLYTVSSATGVRPITFDTVWCINLPADVKTTSQTGGAIPAVADLDGDGSPEFVVTYYIIETNGTICPTRMNYRGGIVHNTYMSISYVADLDTDGIPEITVGTDVYKYDGTTATLWKRCPSFYEGQEGTNMAADIDLDGNVDLVYHDNDHSSAGSMVIWTPVLAPDPPLASNSNQGVIGTIITVSGYSCYPVVGDIDGIVSPSGKKYPEICYNSSGNTFRAYYYDETTSPQSNISSMLSITYLSYIIDPQILWNY